MTVCKDRAKGRPLGRLWQWSSKGGGMDGGLGIIAVKMRTVG